MSTLGQFIVVLGLLIIATRAPLVFAPEGWRSVVLKLFKTPARMRAFGAFLGGFGAVAAWVGSTEATPLGEFVYTAGIMVMVLGVGLFIPFASSMGAVFRQIIGAMGASVLRGVGVLAVLIGAWIVWYGMGL